jgi:glc operon protein GlcG
MQTYIELGEEEARIAIDTAVSELRRRGKTGSIAVGDRHGEVIALWRMNGASLPSAVIAADKVFTSSRVRRKSGDTGRDTFADNALMSYHGSSRYVGWDGGAPVMVDGQCVGSVAISGLKGEEDLEIAEIAIAAILNSLKS